MSKTKTVLGRTLEEIKEEVAQELGYKSNSVFSAHEQLLINPHGYNYKVLSRSIDQVAERYAQSQNQELIEQNRELVFVLQNIVNMLEVDAKISVESIRRVLTKYNHLK